MFTQLAASAAVILCCLAASCHAQMQSRSCYSSSCSAPNYTLALCHEGSMPCPSASTHCISGSMYTAATGHQWVKRCYVPGDSSIPYQCQGYGHSSRCASQIVNGIRQNYCYTCCGGNLCNVGRPLKASASCLGALAPLSLLALAATAWLLH